MLGNQQPGLWCCVLVCCHEKHSPMILSIELCGPRLRDVFWAAHVVWRPLQSLSIYAVQKIQRSLVHSIPPIVNNSMYAVSCHCHSIPCDRHRTWQCCIPVPTGVLSTQQYHAFVLCTITSCYLCCLLLIDMPPMLFVIYLSLLHAWCDLSLRDITKPRLEVTVCVSMRV